VKSIFLAAMVSLCVPSVVYAEVIALCGESTGYSYFMEDGLVAPGDGGWGEDKISSGNIILTRDGKNYDITYTDTTGGTRSATSDGGVVTGTDDGAGTIVVIVIYKTDAGIGAEHYLFRRNGEYGEVVWGTIKSTVVFSKVSAFKSVCKF
jgi:hypothetical protein